MIKKTAAFFVVTLAFGVLMRPAVAQVDSAALLENRPLEIIRITPEGVDVPASQQLVLQFNRAVVPLGRMERLAAEIPVAINPALPCEWRWLNSSALSCFLDKKEAMQPATVYRVTVEAGKPFADGLALTEPYAHTFTTQRPDVSWVNIRRWLAPGRPLFQVVLNQAVTKESAEQHLYIEVSGTRYSVTAMADTATRQLTLWARVRETAFFWRADPQKADDDASTVNGVEARRVWLVQPQEALPQDTAAALKIEPGLKPAVGGELSVAARTLTEFRTFPEAKVIGVRCTTNAEEEITFKPGEALAAARCNPMAAIRLVFNMEIDATTLRRGLAATVDGKPVALWRDGEETDPETSEEGTYRSVEPEGYSVYLPYGLKAAATYTLSAQTAQHGFFGRILAAIKSLLGAEPETELLDVFGRPLKGAFSITFATDDRKPNYVLEYSNAVLESQVNSDVPLYVNNLESVTLNYDALTATGLKTGQTHTQQLPPVKNVQFAVPLGVRDLLGGKSGAVSGELLVSDAEKGEFFAVVSPYQVQVKMGHFNTLVWVTDFASGAPVVGANVKIYRGKPEKLTAPKTSLSTAMTGADGTASLAGSDTLDPRLKNEYNGLMLSVENAGELAVMPLDSNYALNGYRTAGESFYPTRRKEYGHLKAWGTTAQGVYRAGDTIQYKLYVRNQDNQTLTAAKAKGYRLKIIDPTGNAAADIKDVTLDAFGGYSGEFTPPKQAPVGWYQFKLYATYAATNGYDEEADSEGGKDKDSKALKLYPLRVLVSDFTPSPFKVSTQLSGDIFRSGQDISVSSSAKLHSGGAYTDAAVRITAMLESKPFAPNTPQANGFTFGGSDEGERDTSQVFQKADTLNPAGEYAVTFTVPEQTIPYGRLTVETAVQDDRGKSVVASAVAEYAAVDRFVGLKASGWVFNAGKPFTIDHIVVNERGAPEAGTAVSITLQREETKASRVKGAGNAYLNEYTTEWVDSGSCAATSVAAAASCTLTPPKAGYYRAVATIQDTKGHSHQTELSLYVTGKDYVQWSSGDDNALTLIPEKATYAVGENARYLVKNPYPGARALITIERYGVLDHFVQTLEGSTPVIEFPVKPDYLPGYYLSVTVFSPRVDKPIEVQDGVQVDLGKPTFRIGYVTVPVRDTYKEMLVTAKTDKEVYKPREIVTAQLSAAPRFKDKNEPIEYAVAVVDEAVFDLIQGGKDYYDPYKGFYGLEGLDVQNYSLLTRLIGRQNFEKKGANPGGDGGRDLGMRSIFKFVSYWNPALAADKDGRATISFPVPDNLTGWRILAMAVTPSDRLGVGEQGFKVNRATEVRPVMPNQVTEGDSFSGGFSVMNRTDKERTLKVAVRVAGNVKEQPLFTREVTLAPYKREVISLPLETTPVDTGVSSGAVRFVITAGDALDSDGLEHSVPVQKRRALESASTSGTTTTDSITEALQFPDKIHTDVGGLSLTASPSVIGNVGGAFKYVRDYPYLCWEQRLTKALMALHYKNLRGYLPDDVTWNEAEALPKQLLLDAASFQAPNGGMAYWQPTDARTDAYLSAYTALAFNWLKKSGYEVPAAVEEKLHAYLQTYLRQDTPASGYSGWMTATVRAVALAALAERDVLTLADVERYRSQLPRMSLFGKAFFLQAASTVPGAEAMANEAATMMLAQTAESGNTFRFNETLDDGYARILASPMRDSCAALSSLTAYGKTAAGKKVLLDIPVKLARTITLARGSRDAWQSTQENLFCLNTLTDYARLYENTKPAYTVTAALDGAAFGSAAFKDLRDKPVTLQKAFTAADPGRKAALTLSKQGEGRLYYTARMDYAPLEESAVAKNAGMEIRREYSVERDGKWQLLNAPFTLKQGELVRVDVYLSLPTTRNYVVVDDPIPGGLEPLNRDLATASVVDADKGAFEAAGGAFWFNRDNWREFDASGWSFYHKELRHDSARFYADTLSAGNYHLSYTAQAIASGSFVVMPEKAVEMYDPDVFGMGVPATLVVQPKP